MLNLLNKIIRNGWLIIDETKNIKYRIQGKSGFRGIKR